MRLRRRLLPVAAPSCKGVHAPAGWPLTPLLSQRSQHRHQGMRSRHHSSRSQMLLCVWTATVTLMMRVDRRRWGPFCQDNIAILGKP